MQYRDYINEGVDYDDGDVWPPVRAWVMQDASDLPTILRAASWPRRAKPRTLPHLRPVETACPLCDAYGPCRFDGEAFICADRDGCDARQEALREEWRRESEADEAQRAADEARLGAWLASPEGQAHQAECERINEQTWAVRFHGRRTVVRSEDDLPF